MYVFFSHGAMLTDRETASNWRKSFECFAVINVSIRWDVNELLFLRFVHFYCAHLLYATTNSRCCALSLTEAALGTRGKKYWLYCAIHPREEEKKLRRRRTMAILFIYLFWWKKLLFLTTFWWLQYQQLF